MVRSFKFGPFFRIQIEMYLIQNPQVRGDAVLYSPSCTAQFCLSTVMTVDCLWWHKVFTWHLCIKPFTA